jgi:hypothetical protein
MYISIAPSLSPSTHFECNSAQQKSPETRGFFVDWRRYLDLSHVRGLKPFRTLGYFERYTIAFNKGFKAIAYDRGKMTKNIFAIFLLQKTKTLAVIKPFYSSIYHFVYLLLILLVSFSGSISGFDLA